jgi:hypothetical protein
MGAELGKSGRGGGTLGVRQGSLARGKGWAIAIAALPTDSPFPLPPTPTLTTCITTTYTTNDPFLGLPWSLCFPVMGIPITAPPPYPQSTWSPWTSLSYPLDRGPLLIWKDLRRNFPGKGDT